MACHLPIGGCAMRGGLKGAGRVAKRGVDRGRSVFSPLGALEKIRGSQRGSLARGQREVGIAIVGAWVLLENERVSSRGSRGAERLPDPDPVRTEIAAQLERLPQKPRPNCRAHGARDARHELVGAPRRRDSRGGRQLDDAFWEVATSFFFGFCVNVFGWRLSDQVELF